MGEILNELIEKRDRLLLIKNNVTNYDINKLNAKIAKLNFIIDKITTSGWDP